MAEAYESTSISCPASHHYETCQILSNYILSLYIISPTTSQKSSEIHLPSGELTFCHGKSPFLMGKSTISLFLWPFSIAMLVHQRVTKIQCKRHSKHPHQNFPSSPPEVLQRLPPRLAPLAAPDAAAPGGRAPPGARLCGADAVGAQSVGSLEDVGRGKILSMEKLTYMYDIICIRIEVN